MVDGGITLEYLQREKVQRKSDALRIACLCWKANDILTWDDMIKVPPDVRVSAANTLAILANTYETALRLFGSDVWNEAINEASKRKGVW